MTCAATRRFFLTLGLLFLPLSCTPAAEPPPLPSPPTSAGAPVAPVTPLGETPAPTPDGQLVQAAPPVRVGTRPLTAAPTVVAKRVIVVDYASGRVLYEKSADEKCAVASTQKLLTALCVTAAGNLDKPVVVAKTDTYVEPTKLYVKPGETYTRRELLKALVVKSGNDIARVLARDNAGSQVKFSAVMNARARSYGMRNSNFLNAHGLTENGQFSTARDVSILARKAFADPVIRSMMRIKEYTFRYSDGRTKPLRNTNRVLHSVPFCNGMKTGTTRASGRCLVASGTLNGRTAICVVLGSTSKAIWKDSEALLRWALERPAAAQ